MTDQELITKFYEDIRPSTSCPYSEGTIGYIIFTQLEEPYRTQAINNTINQHCEEYLHKNHAFGIVSVLNSSFYSFSWIDSPEGGTYWNELYKKLKYPYPPTVL